MGLRPKEFWAVNDVSFELKRGECLGLIGRNGAGKTTLLRMLNGLIKPDAGRIETRGRVGALIALGAGFNPILTGRENIYTNASVLGLSKKETDAKLDEIIDFAEIGDFIDTPVQNYSSGMAVRLGFAIASSLEPDILLLDEVLAVGDLGFRFKCFQRIGKVLRNAAVIFVSHSMPEVANRAQKIMWLDQGKIRMLDADRNRVIQAYTQSFTTVQHRQLGSGEAELSNIRIAPVDRAAPNAILRHGEDVAVEFTVKFKTQKPKAYVHVNIIDQSGREVLQCMTQAQNLWFENRGKPLHIKMTIPKLPLNAGEYSLYVIVGGTQKMQHWAVHHGVCPFSVSSLIVGWCPVQPVVHWNATYDE